MINSRREIDTLSVNHREDDTMPFNPQKCKFCEIIRGDIQLFDNNDFIGPYYDVPYSTDTFAVFPDGAPLTPGHTLIAPVEHTLSIARMDNNTRSEIRKGIDRVRSALENRHPEKTAFYFEHGSCEEDEATGCSTTHAHFHILFGPKNVLSNCEARDDFEMVPTISDAWRRITNSDYYLFGRFGGPTYVQEIVEHPSLKCRMYLRKLFANLLGAPHRSDYRRYTGQGKTHDSLVRKPEELLPILEELSMEKRVPQAN